VSDYGQPPLLRNYLQQSIGRPGARSVHWAAFQPIRALLQENAGGSGKRPWDCGASRNRALFVADRVPWMGSMQEQG